MLITTAVLLGHVYRGKCYTLYKKKFLKENLFIQQILIKHLFCVRHGFTGDNVTFSLSF